MMLQLETSETTTMHTRPGRRPSCDPRVETLLQQWGADVGSRLTVGDWPQTTILGRLIELGANGASQAGAPPPLGNPDVVRVERAVMLLHPKHRRAVIEFYASRNRGNVSLCARQCRCSNRQLQDLLKHARDFLAVSLLGNFH
jgi:hypothetical protein